MGGYTGPGIQVPGVGPGAAGRMLLIDDANVDVIKWGLKEIASPFGLDLTPPAARRSAQGILDKIQAARVASRYCGR